jgi:hypothetical protein
MLCAPADYLGPTMFGVVAPAVVVVLATTSSIAKASATMATIVEASAVAPSVTTASTIASTIVATSATVASIVVASFVEALDAGGTGPTPMGSRTLEVS